MSDLEKHQRMANAIRFLAIDAVEKAKSGHPGLPMGAADIATVLFTEFLKFDPTAPNWADRDRFVLSAGHGSMLLYSLLYLLGYEDFPIEELQRFPPARRKDSRSPGIRSRGRYRNNHRPAGSGSWQRGRHGHCRASARADRFGADLVNHYTYVLAGDGCLMEGISQEALSMAGHLKLNKLIVIWDDNGISIDGAVSITDSTNQIARFEASGWNTISIDGHDPDAIASAIRQAQESDKPTMIAAKTTIGFGAPTKAGTAKVHGAPLGAEEITGTREALNWPHEPFEVPSDILDAWRIAGLRSAQAHKDWQKRFNDADAELRAEFDRRNRGDLPSGLKQAVLDYKKQLSEDLPTMATRKASEAVLGVLNEVIPETIGGSADLTGSNNTKTAQTLPVTPDDFSGRYIHYGIREHGMAAAMNGMALHGGLIPYSGGFLIFSDYCRPSIRLAALMNQRVIHVMTHDSIGLGEDGPTHQPVEHFAALRAIPNLTFFRPADVTETLECWQLSLESKDAPSVLALTRQNLPAQRKSYEEKNLCANGAYVLIESEDDAAVTIFASGSEVEIAVEAHKELTEAGIAARVVSVPSFELFEAQSADYQDAVIGSSPVKIAVEAGIRMGWDRFIGNDGLFVGMTGFGASAPYKELYEHFGITKDAIVAAAKEKLGA